MTATMHIGGKEYRIGLDRPVDISIPLDFRGEQPNSYGVPRAQATAYVEEGFVGDTRQGGSCNFDVVSVIPHCNGTHTECIGHLTDERLSVTHILRDALIPATVLSVATTNAGDSSEQYPVAVDMHDQLITSTALAMGLANAPVHFQSAIIIRTLPNNPGKLYRSYADEAAPFFSQEAMTYLAARPVRHLLVDIPSLDRAYDDGKLMSHRLFWNVPSGSRERSTGETALRTVTEFIFVPDSVADGHYLLNLQIAPFMLDAAPSRPLLFTLEEVTA